MAAIGIDLGTTYSSVGVCVDGKIIIVPNEMDKFSTPSIVSEDCVGEEASNQGIINPQNTIYDTKRMIGRKFTDPEFQKDLHIWPFKVIRGDDDHPAIEVNWDNEKKSLYPEEISAMILTKMKNIAEEYLGTKVEDAVITVPAYFKDAQRQATHDAAVIAGLNVLRFINEPTAAAIGYGFKSHTDEIRHVLIYDLGGGTFDVTVLEVKGLDFTVLSSGGNSHLGGEDFDNRMVTYIADKFQEKYQCDLRQSQRSVITLRKACEQAKLVLSVRDKATIICESIYQGHNLICDITRKEFEELNKDLFKHTLDTIKKVIHQSNLDKAKIDEVVLVGGSSKIPYIKKMISKYFDGKDVIRRNIDPEQAVAYGATIQAGIIKGIISNININEVTTFSLGVECNTVKMDVLIPRGTKIPIQISKFYTTNNDQQDFAQIKIYEGESEYTKDCDLLGSFYLDGFNTEQIPKIKITFEINENGILTASAVEENTGNSFKLRVGKVVGENAQNEK
ncbi:cytoplasmic heat shock protein 70 [Histomonas meleagridis]|uniref:cytoplasmic heat shock protein 70 n=1 Tax=Histomonas meleagridis TaxID=135588 RepID=UPI00355AC11F|nr:cytoplasmic heat shock protein 70 [Histomonas meleagridis]KAH0803324.1 cytoplasmic heat shock protein 70 [Histomonas meleagridis]